jgi:uncharacterized membrane-anchored protein
MHLAENPPMTTTTSTTARQATAPSLGRKMLNKVPEVTLYFWIIKVLCTTVGETAADNLNTGLKLGLTNTTYLMGGLLLVVLFFQFRLRRYVPGIYWLAVVVLSIVGTLVTDNLVDNYGVALQTTTVGFAIALAVTFTAWYASERTLSIHTIYTTRREAFYWLAILFTFALGTAAGDLAAEKLNLGYWKAALVFGAAIGIVFAAHRFRKLGAITAFWIAYVLTRPLGASIGDYLAQTRHDGGLGLGTTVTSVIFLALILALVVYLTLSRRDVITTGGGRPADDSAERRVLVVANKTAATPGLIEAVRERAATGPARFVLLVPNPDDHLIFDRVGEDVRAGKQVLELALPLLQEAAGDEVEGVVANSPNAYDDIVEELSSRSYDEVIISTLPTHVSHWLHVDLPSRVGQFGVPVTTITGGRSAKPQPAIAA